MEHCLKEVEVEVAEQEWPAMELDEMSMAVEGEEQQQPSGVMEVEQCGLTGSHELAVEEVRAPDLVVAEDQMGHDSPKTEVVHQTSRALHRLLLESWVGEAVEVAQGLSDYSMLLVL